MEGIFSQMGILISIRLQYCDSFISRLCSRECQKLQFNNRNNDRVAQLPYCRCRSHLWQLSKLNSYKVPRVFNAGNVECESCGTSVLAVEDGRARLNLAVRERYESSADVRIMLGSNHARIEQVTDPAESKSASGGGSQL